MPKKSTELPSINSANPSKANQNDISSSKIDESLFRPDTAYMFIAQTTGKVLDHISKDSSPSTEINGAPGNGSIAPGGISNIFESCPFYTELFLNVEDKHNMNAKKHRSELPLIIQNNNEAEKKPIIFSTNILKNDANNSQKPTSLQKFENAKKKHLQELEKEKEKEKHLQKHKNSSANNLGTQQSKALDKLEQEKNNNSFTPSPTEPQKNSPGRGKTLD